MPYKLEPKTCVVAVNQVDRSFEAKDSQIIEYLTLMGQLMGEGDLGLSGAK